MIHSKIGGLDESAMACTAGEMPTTQQEGIDSWLREFADAINVNSKIAGMGGEAEISNGGVELLKHGNLLGRWSIYDCWFEYKGQACGQGQVYRAAWLERAISMTISIVDNVPVMDDRSTPTDVIFRATQIDGADMIVGFQKLGNAYPNLVDGQLALRLRPGTDAAMALRIARQLNRDVVGIVILQQK